MALDDDAALGAVRGVLDDPETARERVPTLLEMLEGAPRAAIAAAWALCLLVEEYPSLAAPLADQIEAKSGLAAELAMVWIEARHDVSERGDTISGAGGDAKAEGKRKESEQRPEDIGAGSERSDGQAAGQPRGEARVDQQVPADQRDSVDRPESAVQPASTDQQPSADQQTPADQSVSADQQAPTDQSVGRGTDEDWEKTDPAVGDVGVDESVVPDDEVVVNSEFMIEGGRTVLDSVSIIESVWETSYSNTYAGLATVDATERAVLVTTYLPPRDAQRAPFGVAFDHALEDWRRVHGHRNILTVHDWGVRPHPWVVTGYATETLATTSRLPLDLGLQIAYDVARAIGRAHEAGVHHLTLDPRAVAIDRRPPQPEPRVQHFGLAAVYADVGGRMPLDPRFGAPEYFTDTYGDRDWMTDVYQVGAILYYAVTGRAPYERTELGSEGPVGVPRQVPSSVREGVPSEVDYIIENAMATEKLSRYESVDELARDLLSVLESGGESK